MSLLLGRHVEALFGCHLAPDDCWAPDLATSPSAAELGPTACAERTLSRFFPGKAFAGTESEGVADGGKGGGEVGAGVLCQLHDGAAGEVAAFAAAGSPVLLSTAGGLERARSCHSAASSCEPVLHGRYVQRFEVGHVMACRSDRRVAAALNPWCKPRDGRPPTSPPALLRIASPPHDMATASTKTNLKTFQLRPSSCRNEQAHARLHKTIAEARTVSKHFTSLVPGCTRALQHKRTEQLQHNEAPRNISSGKLSNL